MNGMGSRKKYFLEMHYDIEIYHAAEIYHTI